MSSPLKIFDHSLLDIRRKRARRQYIDGNDFLWQELASRLLDRLDDVKRNFPQALELGSHHGKLGNLLKDKYGIEHLTQIETLTDDAGKEILKVEPASANLILSIASLQWTNDLPGMLTQIYYALKPDGLFMATIPGEETLFELRASLDAAMLACTGGISPRISPMLGLKDAADLVQRAGFTLPVIDHERIEVSYSSSIKLMHDLRAMGQTNALIERSDRPLTREILEHMQEHYATHFAHPEGGVRATFDMVTVTGWSAHASQAKPQMRGSAKVSMKDVLS